MWGIEGYNEMIETCDKRVGTVGKILVSKVETSVKSLLAFLLISRTWYVVKTASFNPLMPGGNKKGHIYLNKPAAKSCRFV